MAHEYDDGYSEEPDGYRNEYGHLAYVPPRECTQAFVEDLRAELVKTLGGRDYVVRYLKNGQRSKHALPRGPALFACCDDIELVSTYANMHHLRVKFVMDCHPPKGQEFALNSPYREIVDFYFWERGPRARTPIVAASPEGPKNGVAGFVTKNRAAVITVLCGVLAAGAIISPYVGMRGYDDRGSRPARRDDPGEELVPQRVVVDRLQELPQESFDQ
jgi:hypothetical protein